MTLPIYKNRKGSVVEETSVVPEGRRICHLKRPIDAYDFGFIVLCPERNLGGFQNTVRSIHHQYGSVPILGVVGNDATATEVATLKSHCETLVGEDTITSLINTGMRNTKAPWNVIVFAGSWVRGNIYRKFDAFVRSRKDILFPVVDGHINFVDGSMNGIVMHRDTFAEIGDFSTHPMQKEGHNELELIKLWWAMGAMDKGCLFKAIIGMRVV